MPRLRCRVKIPGRGARRDACFGDLETEVGNVLLDEGSGMKRAGWPVIVTFEGVEGVGQQRAFASSRRLA